MPSSRDVGGRDVENTVTVPGPIVRSRHIEPAHEALLLASGVADEIRCPTCRRRLPGGITVRCPDDGTELESDAPRTDASE